MVVLAFHSLFIIGMCAGQILHQRFTLAEVMLINEGDMQFQINRGICTISYCLIEFYYSKISTAIRDKLPNGEFYFYFYFLNDELLCHTTCRLTALCAEHSHILPKNQVFRTWWEGRKKNAVSAGRSCSRRHPHTLAKAVSLC